MKRPILMAAIVALFLCVASEYSSAFGRAEAFFNDYQKATGQ